MDIHLAELQILLNCLSPDIALASIDSVYYCDSKELKEETIR